MKISIKDGIAIAQLLILRGSGVLSLFLVEINVKRHYEDAIGRVRLTCPNWSNEIEQLSDLRVLHPYRRNR